LYISYVFKSEEQEFINEGLKDQLSELNYSDNGAVIELMDKAGNGIFDMIDEVTQLGSGTDDALYQKIIKTHKDHKHLNVPKLAKDRFSIVHTAKTVEYSIVGFRAKNKSEISGDIVKGFMSSSNELLVNVFLVLCG
jgi:myosin heavy subunit